MLFNLIFVYIFVASARPLRSTAKVLELINDDSELSALSSEEDEQNTTATGIQPHEGSDSAEGSSDSESDEEPLSSLISSRTHWKCSESFSPLVTEFTMSAAHNDVDSRADWEPVDYVKQYLDKDLFEILSHCTNVTSVATKGKSLNTTAAEIERFLGACLFMSCINYPRVRMFWQKGLEVPVLTSAITRDRYFRIRNSLKTVIDTDISDETKKHDRLWKVRPVLDRVRAGCLQISRDRDVSIDEQMIPFTGACELRQYVPNKPNPVGLKNFVAASHDGLVVDFVVYQGANSFSSFPPELKLGIGGTVVAHLAETLQKGTRIYCDRYFTSPSLIEYMQSKEVYVTGTIMKNRVPGILDKLSSDKDLQKRGRGACDVVVRQDGKMAVVKWFDNKPIVMLSAIHAKNPEDECRRWSKKEKKYVMVKRPEVVRVYNSKMGGVDLCDRMISYYRMKTRTKKWTIRTMTHFFDLAVVNSWILYCRDKKILKVPRKDILQFLQFKLQIAQAYLAATDDCDDVHISEDDSEEGPSAKRRRSVEVPAIPQRTSAAKHLPEMTDVKNSMRCRMPSCNSKSKVRCIACNVFLCMTCDRNCFLKFHKK